MTDRDFKEIIKILAFFEHEFYNKNRTHVLF